MACFKTIASGPVSLDGVKIQEADTKLQLLHNIQVLILETALEASLALTSSRVVGSRE